MKKTFLSALVLASGLFFSCGTSGTSGSDSDSTMTTGDTTSSTTTTTMNSGMDTAHNNMASAGPVSEMDKKFMMEAAAGGNTEIGASKIALERSSNDRIKNFANMMIADHTKAGDELKSIASQKNVTLPDSVMPDQHQELEMLRKSTGKSFDRDYVAAMVKDHKATVDKFEMAAQKCDDSNVKAFASKTLPAIKMHLDSAMALQKSM